jgi:hypothetical protein
VGIEPGAAEEIPDSGFLAVSHFLGHVHQQAAIAFVDTTKQATKASEGPGVFSTASPRDIVCRLPLGKIRQHGRFFAVVEELVERDFHSPRQLFQSFDRRNGVTVFDARNVTAEEPSALLDVALGELLCFTEQTDAFSNYHVRYCHMISYRSQQANFEVAVKLRV